MASITSSGFPSRLLAVDEVYNRLGAAAMVAGVRANAKAMSVGTER
jgi:hypothetical protein